MYMYMYIMLVHVKMCMYMYMVNMHAPEFNMLKYALKHTIIK